MKSVVTWLLFCPFHVYFGLSDSDFSSESDSKLLKSCDSYSDFVYFEFPILILVPDPIMCTITAIENRTVLIPILDLIPITFRIRFQVLKSCRSYSDFLYFWFQISVPILTIENNVVLIPIPIRDPISSIENHTISNPFILDFRIHYYSFVLDSN